MIFVLLVICALVLLGALLLIRNDDEWDCTWKTFVGSILAAISGLGLLIATVSVPILIGEIAELNVIDDKIAMYQEENTRIEEQIATVVEQYQEYETEIFTSVAPESSITLVAMYPDLKSDTLVQSQIETYTANNQKIKELKESKITGSVKRWWLYFGG